VLSKEAFVQVVFAPDGRFVAAACFGSDVKIWNILYTRQNTFQGIRKAMDLGHRASVLAVAFNRNSTRVATCSKDGYLRVWKIDVRCSDASRSMCAFDKDVCTDAAGSRQCVALMILT
jgi:WD40 repeat protein